MSYSQRRGNSRSRFAPRRPQRNFSGRSRIDRSRYIRTAMEPTQEEIYEPQHRFVDFGLADVLLQNVLAHGYDTPTPIQDQTIPSLMLGQDVVGIANTGTGKTAAFLLPLIHKVLHDSNQGVLILAPTRELALQIQEEFQAFARNLPVSCALAIGGQSLNNQISRLRDNPHFVIGTPGRLIDLIQRRAFNPALFTNIVLDEVDRMLDIGFRRDIQYLISQLSQERQSAFFSATLNRDTEQIMHSFLRDPVIVSVKKREVVLQIEQDIVQMKPGQNKVQVLHQLLQQEEFKKVIVFGRTKHGINRLEQQLFERGIRVSSIHGNKTQNARQKSLQAFKLGRVQALLATDIAARGIDIEDVTHVINFDEPESYDDYVHRIGRTGRAGKLGKALTFVG